MDINSVIIKELFALSDEDYRDFHSKLMPNIDKDRVIGVRTPEVRKLAKKLSENSDVDIFLKSLPHKYYEENNLHAFCIEGIKDFDECISKVSNFLPYVDNWATCDMMRPKCFKNHKKELLHEIEKWLASDKTYTVRYGIEMLMVHFLDEEFDKRYLDKAAAIISEEYYINMMIAWYFATALAKQYETTISYIEEMRLPAWVHNKTIQKSIESYRISEEQKKYLKSLKITNSTNRR